MLTEIKFKGLSSDLVFKYIFSKEIFLRDLINSYFEYVGIDKSFYFSKINAQEVIMPNNIKLKNYYGDIIATLNTGEIINLEMYQKFDKRSYIKSYNYMCRLYSNQMNLKEENYEKSKKVICINFINGNFKGINKYLVNNYEMKHKLTHKIIDSGETEIVLVRVDLVRKLDYNQDTRRFIKWLRLISTSSLEELKEIAKGDDVMEHSVEYVTRYLNGPLNHTFEDYIADKEYVARKDGENAGKKAGIIETAKKMLTKGYTFDIIAEITGLTEEEIEELKE